MNTPTITLSRIHEILNTLNTYTSDNIWQDVILHLDEYDEHHTSLADPSFQSNIIALTDLTLIIHNPTPNTWEHHSTLPHHQENPISNHYPKPTQTPKNNLNRIQWI